MTEELGCCGCLERKPRGQFPLGRAAWEGRGSRRSQVCWVCTEARAWEHYHRRVVTRATYFDVARGVVVRVCVRCEQPKPLLEFGVRQRAGTTDRRGHRVLRDRHRPECRACQGASGSEWDSKQRREGPSAAYRARHAAANRRWRARNIEKARAASRKAKRRLREDPVEWAKYLEDCRINYRLREEAKGRVPRRGRKDATVQTTERRRVEAKPLLAALEALLSRRTAVAGLLSDADGATVEAVCADVGITSRTWRRWSGEAGATVQIGVAERVLANAGVEWHEVYSYDDHADVFLAMEIV